MCAQGRVCLDFLDRLSTVREQKQGVNPFILKYRLSMFCLCVASRYNATLAFVVLSLSCLPHDV